MDSAAISVPQSLLNFCLDIVKVSQAGEERKAENRHDTII